MTNEIVENEDTEVEETGPQKNGSSHNYSIPASIVVAGVIIGIAIMASGGIGSPVLAPTQAGGAGNFAGDSSRAGVDDDAMLGDVDAPVTIVEFSDYQCPFCRQFWQQTLPLIKENYINTGKVRFVYRDFPLSSIHPSAQLAAEATECAKDQGFYWQAHDAVFDGQALLGQGTIQFTQNDVEQWLSRIPGLDVGRVSSCIDNGEKTEEVLADISDGRSSGITGTPGFFVNGTLIPGALPYDAFQQVIESALAEAR